MLQAGSSRTIHNDELIRGRSCKKSLRPKLPWRRAFEDPFVCRIVWKWDYYLHIIIMQQRRREENCQCCGIPLWITRKKSACFPRLAVTVLSRWLQYFTSSLGTSTNNFKLHKKYRIGWVKDLEWDVCLEFWSTNPGSRQEMLRKNTLNAMQNGRQHCCGLRPVWVKSYDSRKNVTQREIELLDSPFAILQYATWQLIKSANLLHFASLPERFAISNIGFLAPHGCQSRWRYRAFPCYATFILWDQSCDGSACQVDVSCSQGTQIATMPPVVRLVQLSEGQGIHLFVSARMRTPWARHYPLEFLQFCLHYWPLQSYRLPL
jgi:hypothetical protein